MPQHNLQQHLEPRCGAVHLQLLLLKLLAFFLPFKPAPWSLFPEGQPHVATRARPPCLQLLKQIVPWMPKSCVLSPVTMKSPSPELLTPCCFAPWTGSFPRCLQPCDPQQGLGPSAPHPLAAAFSCLGLLPPASVPEGCSNLLIFGRCCHTRQHCQRAEIERGHSSAPAEKGMAGMNIYLGSR